jgi:hypothetical protein
VVAVPIIGDSLQPGEDGVDPGLSVAYKIYFLLISNTVDSSALLLRQDN